MSEDLVKYCCYTAGCNTEFYAFPSARPADSACPRCGAVQTLNDCKDIVQTGASLQSELLAARRIIYALVCRAGGRVEISMSEVAVAVGSTFEMHYDHVNNCQVLQVRK